MSSGVASSGSITNDDAAERRARASVVVVARRAGRPEFS